MTRVVALADSDSYLKWSAATLSAMPAQWHCEQWLIRNPIAPSPAQVEAATDLEVQRISAVQAIRRLQADPPEVLLLAATGPVVQTFLRFGALRLRSRRPVLVTGLPGISIPATERALEFRSGCDLFLLHSHREIGEFSAAARRLDVPIRFGLATLPFINQALPSINQARAEVGSCGGTAESAVDDQLDSERRSGRRIVFAAQAKVPAAEEEREQVLRAFAAMPPEQQVVVKLRALAGEQQTHRELLPYQELWDGLVQREGYAPELIEFVAGSMVDALADADGFATVSSTAALEAIGTGVPIIVLTDFGVSAETINEVFVGSGCLGTLEDLAAGRLRQPAAEWLRDNYFHPAEDADWVQRITDLVRERERQGLNQARIRVVDGRWRQGQRHLRLLLPRPLLRLSGHVLRRVKRVRRKVRRLVRGTPAPDPAGGEGQDATAA